MSEPIITKRCSKCKKFKPLAEFHKNRTTKDGYQSECKICVLKRSKEYYQTEQGKRNRKQNRQSKKGKVAHKRYRQSEVGKAIQSAAQKRFYIQHPKQCKAVSAVQHAIKIGKLPRPNTLQCHYGPVQANQYHHWHSYEPEHYLDVVPVCIKCHRKIHRKASLDSFSDFS